VLTRVNGGSTSVTPVGENPTVFALSQNYPNPFNPSTRINFQLPSAARARMVVYDMLGNEVAELVNEDLAAGSHEVVFSANRMASGTYYCRLNAGSYSAVRSMVLMK
jgi:hypothetical protein